MAYNTSIGPRVLGDILYDKDPDPEIDFGSDKIDLKTNNTTRFRVTNDGVEITGSLEIISGSTTVFKVDSDDGAADQGRMLAKQTVVMHHNCQFNTLSKRYLGLPAGGTHTAAPTEDSVLIMPFDARLIKLVYMQGNAPDGSERIGFGLQKASAGTFPSSYVDSGPVAQITASVTTQYATYTIDPLTAPMVTGSWSCNKGETIAISMDPVMSTSPGDVFVTTVWEYNLFEEIS